MANTSNVRRIANLRTSHVSRAKRHAMRASLDMAAEDTTSTRITDANRRQLRGIRAQTCRGEPCKGTDEQHDNRGEDLADSEPMRDRRRDLHLEHLWQVGGRSGNDARSDRWLPVTIDPGRYQT